ncbi:ARM repeat-containing protein [Xylariomycetidae sp. FL0641]|nr:ARM repeat-containing protein [Xylariomycetidae sp. FL0641]
MPKPRTKRQAIRDERKAKRRDKALAAQEASKAAKRQRLNHHDDDDAHQDDGDQVPTFADGYEQSAAHVGQPPPPDREFFGMLSDQEQEYFRSVDEQLDIDDFPSDEERQLYLASVFTEAQGKELKLACSQSCSRLMERLILMSNTRQKKKLFEQFAGHFLNLIQHRFASHCCETLFLESAPIVTRELGGERDDLPPEDDDQDQKTFPYMEELFLLTLDEMEGQLSYLMTDKFASHTLRVLLIILSGRPLEQSQTKSLIHSKKKERISVPWTFNKTTESKSDLRAVPNSFNLATKKIVADTVAGMNTTELRVMATHPTGNPVLQLLLELDIALNAKAGDESGDMTLLWRLLPGAPASLQDATTPASDFVNSMLYDAIGSRLLETLITNCPGKLFKALNKHVFSSRIQSLLRNDIASYPAIRVLNRLSKEDLAAAVHKTLPEFGKLVTLSRFNVIKTLFERCQARQATAELEALMKALIEACGSNPKNLVPKLCLPQAETDETKGQDPLIKNRSALVSHGCQLTTTLLSLPGLPSKSIQTSISSLSDEQVAKLALSSAPTSHVLVDALSTPSQNKIFHKALVASLRPHVMDLAQSGHGSRVLNAIISVPSRSDGISLPFHIKESIMTELGQHEPELRESFEGRRVWRSWKGDLWKNRRTDWIAWAKEVDSASEKVGSERQPKSNGVPYGNGSGIRGHIKDRANGVDVNFDKKRKRDGEGAR